ncbi:DUF3794 domain-containing protein [Inediibacterium massiliense]|uniref:DUF3794 domain-containing protein n=1 Tax=Inediibacterium massiliense TaxID=1658111 RepID=UPI0006B4BE78|nr:DUF3794 domain-containing protein [Inediibacterium massiliense]
MKPIVKDLIEYSGIAMHLPESPCAFQQMDIQEHFEIPNSKPNIEQLIRVMADIQIISTKIIRTPVAKSIEGQSLSGWKLIVEGEVKQKIEYVADEPTQSVHAVHINTPFSSYIILSPDFDSNTVVNVTGYIEDIFALQIDKRRIFKNIAILLDASQYV